MARVRDMDPRWHEEPKCSTESFFFSFFFLRKLLESCGYLAEHLLERLHVQGGVVVLRAHWLNHLSQFLSSQPLASWSHSLFLTRARSFPGNLLSTRLRNSLASRFSLSRDLASISIPYWTSFPTKRISLLSELRGYLEFYNNFSISLKDKRIDYGRDKRSLFRKQVSGCYRPKGLSSLES